MMAGPSEVKMKLAVSSLEKGETLIVGVALVPWRGGVSFSRQVIVPSRLHPRQNLLNNDNVVLLSKYTYLRYVGECMDISIQGNQNHSPQSGYLCSPQPSSSYTGLFNHPTMVGWLNNPVYDGVRTVIYSVHVQAASIG